MPQYETARDWIISMNNQNQATRVPVIDPNGKLLMPTTSARARRWIQSGKAVCRRNKLGVFYVQLIELPSGYETQTIVAGTDRGKCFTGIAFQTKRELRLHCFMHVCQGFTNQKRKPKTVNQ